MYKRSQPIPGEVEVSLVKFRLELQRLTVKSTELANKAKTDPTYQAAAKKADELVKKLQTHCPKTITLPRSEFLVFKENCIDAINEAREILETHRGWKKILDNIAKIFLYSTRPIGKYWFFATDTAKHLDKITDALAVKAAVV